MEARKMNSNLITSMTPLSGAPTVNLPGVPSSAKAATDGSELACLARLTAVLGTIEQLLAQGKAEELPEICREAAGVAHEISSLYLQLPLLGSLVEDGERRKTLLAEIRRQQAFCVAVLRRWRRILVWRREVFRMAGEPVTYTPNFVSTTEPR
jgi:hypothetical protein